MLPSSIRTSRGCNRSSFVTSLPKYGDQRILEMQESNPFIFTKLWSLITKIDVSELNSDGKTDVSVINDDVIAQIRLAMCFKDTDSKFC